MDRVLQIAPANRSSIRACKSWAFKRCSHYGGEVRICGRLDKTTPIGMSPHVLVEISTSAYDRRIGEIGCRLNIPNGALTFVQSAFIAQKKSRLSYSR